MPVGLGCNALCALSFLDIPLVEEDCAESCPLCNLGECLFLIIANRDGDIVEILISKSIWPPEIWGDSI